MDWLRRTEAGLDLRIRLTPNASVDRLEGPARTADGRAHIQARVRAAPEKGAANTALVKLVARALGLPKSRVTVASGTTSRIKTLHIAGDLTPDHVRACLEGE